MWRCAGVGEQRIFFDLVMVLPESVYAAGEDSEDAEKILGKLGSGAVYSLVENHDVSTVLFDRIAHEVKPESGKTVFVGNHKRELITCEKSVQYGA